MELSSAKLENSFISRRNLQSLKNKKICSEEFVSYDVFTIFTAVKHRQTPSGAKTQHRDIAFIKNL